MNFLRKGFTLIELLVVISIIGILLGLSVFGLQGARQSSRDATRKANLELIRSGLEIYKADCNTYPTANIMESLSLVGAAGVGCVDNTYISKIPVDPVSPARSYAYSSTDGVTYTLCAALEGSSSSVSGCGSCTTICNYEVTNP